MLGRSRHVLRGRPTKILAVVVSVVSLTTSAFAAPGDHSGLNHPQHLLPAAVGHVPAGESLCADGGWRASCPDGRAGLARRSEPAATTAPVRRQASAANRVSGPTVRTSRSTLGSAVRSWMTQTPTVLPQTFSGSVS